MNYTQSDAYVTHVGTGHRMHQQSQPVPTMVTDKDLNMVIWSLMQVLNEAGVAPAAFDAANINTYNRLLLALQTLFAPVSAGPSPSEKHGQIAVGDIGDGGSGTVTFPAAFATACEAVLLTVLDPLGFVTGVSLSAQSATGFTFQLQKLGDFRVENITINWLAKGN